MTIPTTPTRHRNTWEPEQHELDDPYVPLAAPMPDTDVADWERATKFWFIAATTVAAVFLATAAVLVLGWVLA